MCVNSVTNRRKNVCSLEGSQLLFRVCVLAHCTRTFAHRRVVYRELAHPVLWELMIWVYCENCGSLMYLFQDYKEDIIHAQSMCWDCMEKENDYHYRQQSVEKGSEVALRLRESVFANGYVRAEAEVVQTVLPMWQELHSVVEEMKCLNGNCRNDLLKLVGYRDEVEDGETIRVFLYECRICNSKREYKVAFPKE